jgi:hypothetical protein
LLWLALCPNDLSDLPINLASDPVAVVRLLPAIRAFRARDVPAPFSPPLRVRINLASLRASLPLPAARLPALKVPLVLALLPPPPANLPSQSLRCAIIRMPQHLVLSTC